MREASRGTAQSEREREREIGARPCVERARPHREARLSTPRPHISPLPPRPPPALTHSQVGLCEITPTACDGTCQLHYSGPGSPCAANLPTPLATVVWSGEGKADPIVKGTLPLVPPGGVCGEFVGACPASQCCSQFGFCVDDASYFCHTAACVLAASPASPTCAAAWGATQPVTRKIKLTTTWGRASPDGVERDVILINGKFPGPTIRGTIRDRVQVSWKGKKKKERRESEESEDGGWERGGEKPTKALTSMLSSLFAYASPQIEHINLLNQVRGRVCERVRQREKGERNERERESSGHPPRERMRSDFYASPPSAPSATSLSLLLLLLLLLPSPPPSTGTACAR